MKLTKRAVTAIAPDPLRDVYIWDDDMSGFGLRVKPSGVRSFMIQYRNSGGISRRVTLGKFGVLTAEQARKCAKEMLADVTQGRDPAARRLEERKAITVRQLCCMYLDAAGEGVVLGKRAQPKKPSTLYTDRGRIERHILPLLGNRKVRDLTAPDIARFLRDVANGKTADDIKTGFRGRAIVKGGRGTAARTVGLLGGILSFAVSEGIIPANPVRGIKRPADQRREVRLTDDQYGILSRRLSEAEASGENPAAILGFRLLALTGCRRGEIEWLRWSEVDRVGRCLRLADSKEGRSIRPLGRVAIELFANVSNQGQFVLAGRLTSKPFTGLSKAWRRIVKQTPLRWLTLHGLRHAYASIAADLGYTEPTIAALLGHGTHTTTGRYIHHLDAALLAAADNVARRIAEAMNDPDTSAKNVIPLRQKEQAV